MILSSGVWSPLFMCRHQNWRLRARIRVASEDVRMISGLAPGPALTVRVVLCHALDLGPMDCVLHGRSATPRYRSPPPSGLPWQRMCARYYTSDVASWLSVQQNEYMYDVDLQSSISQVASDRGRNAGALQRSVRCADCSIPEPQARTVHLVLADRLSNQLRGHLVAA